MVPDEKDKVTVCRVRQWSIQVEADLNQCCNDSELSYWFRMLKSDQSQGWEVYRGVTRLGTIVTTVQKMLNGTKHLLIGPVGGEWVRTIRAGHEFLLELGRFYGVDYGRVECLDERMKKILERYGFEFHAVEMLFDLRERGAYGRTA